MSNTKLPDDTIAAVATPIGRAGIGIIRISGSRAAQIAERIFSPRTPVMELRTHRLYLGNLIDPVTGAQVKHQAVLVRWADGELALA